MPLRKSILAQSCACFIVVLLIAFTLGTPAAAVADECANHYLDIPIATKTAGAGFFANLFKRSGSISFESEQIFHLAKAELPALAVPLLNCGDGCRMQALPYMYFRSVPRRTLSEYPDRDHCQELEELTTKAPLLYDNDTLASVDELITWVGEFSQGEGKQGEELYQRCDRSCSPRYEYRISKLKPSDDLFTVTAYVICGAARDKDDDLYQLSAFFRWQCVAA